MRLQIGTTQQVLDLIALGQRGQGTILLTVHYQSNGHHVQTILHGLDDPAHRAACGQNVVDYHSRTTLTRVGQTALDPPACAVILGLVAHQQAAKMRNVLHAGPSQESTQGQSAADATGHHIEGAVVEHDGLTQLMQNGTEQAVGGLQGTEGVRGHKTSVNIEVRVVARGQLPVPSFAHRSDTLEYLDESLAAVWSLHKKTPKAMRMNCTTGASWPGTMTPVAGE